MGAGAGAGASAVGPAGRDVDRPPECPMRGVGPAGREREEAPGRLVRSAISR